MDDDLPDDVVEYERVWAITALDAVPFPFHLFRCPHEQGHLRALKEAGAKSDDFPTPAQCSKAFKIFVAALGPRITSCPYHLPDWTVAADRAIAAIRLGRDDEITNLRIEDLDPATQSAAWSFFEEPIHLSGSRLGNGQHRTCAMRCAGVPSIPIEESRARGSISPSRSDSIRASTAPHTPRLN